MRYRRNITTSYSSVEFVCHIVLPACFWNRTLDTGLLSLSFVVKISAVDAITDEAFHAFPAKWDTRRLPSSGRKAGKNKQKNIYNHKKSVSPAAVRRRTSCITRRASSGDAFYGPTLCLRPVRRRRRRRRRHRRAYTVFFFFFVCVRS